MAENKQQGDELKKLVDRYNYIIIGLFCGTNLTPILVFYLQGKGEWRWLIISLAISLLIGLLPNAMIDKIQFSQSVSFYRNLWCTFSRDLRLMETLSTDKSDVSSPVTEMFTI